MQQYGLTTPFYRKKSGYFPYGKGRPRHEDVKRTNRWFKRIARVWNRKLISEQQESLD